MESAGKQMSELKNKSQNRQIGTIYLDTLKHIEFNASLGKSSYIFHLQNYSEWFIRNLDIYFCDNDFSVYTEKIENGTKIEIMW